jgi:uncharacterized protein (TIGR03435 family)
MHRPSLVHLLSVGLFSVIVAGAPHAGTHAQVTPAPRAFEVASLKRVTSDIPYGIRPVDPSGRFHAIITLHDLIRIAYGSPLALTESQIVDAPQWTKTDRFEITAKADGALSHDVLMEMMRSLLADRFQLRVRKETRELSLYDLVLDRVGQTGPRLRVSDGQCLSTFAEATANLARSCGFKRFAPTAISALGMTLDDFANGISTRPEVQRVVRNRTGRSEKFDLDVEYTPEPDAPAAAFFTAFREQLGLRFQAATGPLDAYVIERVEPPSPD